jgi:hypothetical protein
MKITLEVSGYEITIDETEEGTVSVVATKDGDTVEEFELSDEGGGEGEEDFDDNETPEGGEDLPKEDDEDFNGDDNEDEGPAKLESFSAFVKKRKL